MQKLNADTQGKMLILAVEKRIGSAGVVVKHWAGDGVPLGEIEEITHLVGIPLTSETYPCIFGGKSGIHS